MIYINGRFLTQPVTGVQRYAIELFRALDRLLASGSLDARGVRPVCLVPPGYDQDPGYQVIEVRRAGRLNGNLWEQIDLPWSARSGCLFSPANIGPLAHPNQVVTIHDASVYAFPQAYSLPFRTKYRITCRRMARAARRIITDSNFSKAELIRWCKAPAGRVEVIMLGSEHLAAVQPDEAILDRAGLRGKRYFLAVGSQSPHKNFRGLVEAFRRLEGEAVHLALVGGTFGKVFQSAEERLPERAVRLGYITDAELRALYQHALGFVFPSFYEGFGLPVLEAMVAGCPVICSGASSLPEVGGDAALYCDPNDPDDIARQMARLRDDASLRERLRQAGYRQAQSFSWDAAARQTWEVLLAALPASRPVPAQSPR